MKKSRRLVWFLIAVLIAGTLAPLFGFLSILPNSSSDQANAGFESPKNHQFVVADDAPKFLLAIFSHDLYKMEPTRRQTIRDTYLSYYKDHEPTQFKHRICSLQEIIRSHQNITWNDCQMAYTFVTGSTHTTLHNRTILQTAHHSSEMILNNKHNHHHHTHETDVLRLDIQENGDYGKTPTWFYYATRLVQEEQLPVDYLIKTDSDTLLIPHRFFRWVQEQEELHHIIISPTTSKSQQQQQQHHHRRRSRIYGGLPMDKFSCGFPLHDHCHNLTCPLYMGGALYFMSMDLAQIVATATPSIPHEDMAVGNALYSSTTTTTTSSFSSITNFSNPEAYINMWKHPVKDPKRMKGLWRKFLKRKRERVQKQQQQQQQQQNLEQEE